MRSNPHTLVMCVTNTVAVDITANMLLAIGAKPAMVEEGTEAAELAKVADAVLINLGTVNPAQAEVMKCAVRACAQSGTPWVLDPVAVHLLTYRRRVMDELMDITLPTAIRGNHSEVDFLRAERAGRLASVPMLSTGEVDRLWLPQNGNPEAIAGGVAMLQQVTATGCSQGAVVAAFLGWGEKPVAALRKASVFMKRAGELAAAEAKAPGSFRTALIDAACRLPIRKS